MILSFLSFIRKCDHVPLQEFTENLKDIEKECLLKGSSLNRLNSVVGQYVQACVQAARQSGVDVLDLWTVYLSDGLHLSDKGNQFVAEHFWTLLERRVTDLPFILPYWGGM
uniref:Isoamyl acetate-hydrolyzing esterase 1 homolog n=2 Tax=Cyprinus carpio TaxID=7962 RepID=A0A8C1ACE0_CYPCA